ncbi:TlpA disulfide reductase family protein [Cerasicoccus fimbriatus]|uniref:TlpA disulfide reductase family protein n=1 Tax=Cerasicoccus fimbriatus TaxID=3014554 RepID=UPI0022B5A298|nr:TlpA disulfide reductase family protein [Cerasicoccus sp. TK19100]
MKSPLSRPRIWLTIFTLLFAAIAQGRTFTMSDGASIDGKVVTFKNGMIVFAKDGGGKSLYSLDAFSAEDQAYLKQQFPDGDTRSSPRTTKTATPAPTPGPKVQTVPPTQKQAQQAAPAADSGHPGLQKLNIGSMAPEIKARPQGQSDFISIKDYRGKLVVVHFWSSSVPQSIEELKGLAYLHHKYKDRGFELIGVAMDTSRRRVNSIEEAIGVSWPMRMDEERETITEWGVTALPTNVLIDQVGVIRRPHITANELQYVLAEHLGPAN